MIMWLFKNFNSVITYVACHTCIDWVKIGQKD